MTASVERKRIFPTEELREEFTGGSWLEGPAQGPDGKIYFSDITRSWATDMQAGHLLRFDPATGQTDVFLSPSGMSNGIVFDSQERMVIAHGADHGGRYVSRIDMKSRRANIVAGLFNGRPFNAPNDVDVDRDDRIYFTDPRYFGHEPIELPVMGVYRIDQQGKVELVVADCSRPNGVAVSPDGRCLYVVENNFIWHDRRMPADFQSRMLESLIVRYDIGDDGRVSNRTTFIDLTHEKGGGADGIEIDDDGNLFAAIVSDDPGVRAYGPDGRELARLSTPMKPANLTLARMSDGQVRMYIAATTTLYSVPVNARPRRFLRS